METAVDLKVQQLPSAELQRGDFVVHAGGIWKCVNRSIQQFQEIDSKQIENIVVPIYQKLDTLQLAPRKWSVDGGIVKF